MDAVTRDKDFKRLVRARATQAGERYTTALRALLRQRKEARMIRVTCEVHMQKLSDDELKSLRERMGREEADVREKSPDVVVSLSASILRVTDEQPILLLTEVGGSRKLPIYCGVMEASAVALAQQGVEYKRPLTHDLLRDVVTAMGQAREVRITDLSDGTYFAELVVADRNGAEQTIPCRPSDGIALAVRTSIPIFVAEPLFTAGTKTA